MNRADDLFLRAQVAKLRQRQMEQLAPSPPADPGREVAAPPGDESPPPLAASEAMSRMRAEERKERAL